MKFRFKVSFSTLAIFCSYVPYIWIFLVGPAELYPPVPAEIRPVPEKVVPPVVPAEIYAQM